MATRSKFRSPKSRPSRRQVLKAAVAAPLVAGLAAEAKSESHDARVKPAPAPDFTPFDLYVAVVTSYGDSRVAMATLDQHEAERFCSTFARMNRGGHSVASMQCVRVSAPGIKAEVFAAVIEREGKPPEACGISDHKEAAEGFAFAWNQLSDKEGHDSQARVVRGVATFAGAVA